MIHFFTTKKKYAFSIIMCVIAFTNLKLNAQNVLAGLTSNGGINGKGTAFSINTNGTGFSLITGFNEWGNLPNGNLFKNDDGNFYGMSSRGGTNNMGTIFRMTPAGEVTVIKQLYYNQDGAYPDGELIKGPDGFLYGMTSAGGTNSYGTIFKISTSGDFTVIKHLNFTTDGAHPHGHLTLGTDGNFYGINYSGGNAGGGTVFKLTQAGIYSVIHNMALATEGGQSYSSLTWGSDGYLYGTAYGGGSNSYGTIFKVATDGKLTVIKQLSPADGTYPYSDIIQAKDGNYYGTCSGGGQYNAGVIFKVTKSGVYSIVRSFSSSADGGSPAGGLLQDTDGTFYGITRSGGSKSGGTIYKLTTANAYSVVHPLDYNNEGHSSSAALVKGNDGSLYAMATYGGAYNYGILFKTTTTGTFSILNSFNGAVKGNIPYGSFIKSADSAYYCTTSSGGAHNHGSIIKICGGKTTVVYSFNKNVDGGYPKGNLLLASNGSFYGMTSTGGLNNSGTIFKLTAGGAFSVVHHFNGAAEGAAPLGSLIQAKDGLLYGMTSGGGSNNAGTIFKMSMGGNFNVIRSFTYATDGGAPTGSLIQAKDDNFYGMTSNGSRIFRLTTGGIYTNMRTLNSSTDGYIALGSLIQGIDGNLYGTCSDGGLYSAGTIFRIGLDGTFKVLMHLNATPQGRMPKGTLLQGPDGTLYGLTSIGGAYNTGTIFKISPSGANYTVLKHLNIATDGGNAFGGLIFAPVHKLVAVAKTATVNEDSSVKITLSGSGGSPLTYTIVKAPAKGKLTGKAPNLTYKPNKNYYGNDQFSYIVGIGCMASEAAIVKIMVNPRPDSPVLATIGNKTIAKDSTLKFKAKATDPDSGQTIKYTLIGAPAGAKINPTSGAFTWTPATVGSFTFKVRATDNGTPALYDEQQVKVTVTTTFASIASASENMLTAPDAAIRMSIFPNPAHDVLHIKLPANIGNVVVRIIDQKGALISTNNFSNTGKTTCDINISQLHNGLYFAEIQANELKETLKFIKN